MKLQSRAADGSNRVDQLSGETCLKGGGKMNRMKILAIALIVGGILALVYGGFSYTKETHEAKLGSLELSIKDKETVNVPVWAGVGAIGVGGALLLFAGKKI
jgi:hypothetical protein